MSTINVNELRGHETTDFRVQMPSDAYINVTGTLEVESGSAQFCLPKGTTGQRPTSPAAGMIRYNTDTSQLEWYNGTEWKVKGGPVAAPDDEGDGGGEEEPAAPYTDLDTADSNIQCFWDGAPEWTSGSTWKTKKCHPNLSNADCEMQNSPTYTSSVSGGDGSIGYWNFNGSNQYGWIRDLNFGSSGSHGPNNNGRLYQFTQGCWFRTSYGSPNSGGGYDFDNWSWYDWDRSEVIGWNIGNHGKLQFAGSSNSTCCYDIVSNTPANDGSWHFGVCTVNNASSSNNIRFYLDGALDGTHSYSFSYFGNGSRRWGFIGDGSEATSNNGGRNSIYYEGDIAQLFLFEEVWSDAKVLEHYTKTRTRFGV